MAFTKAHPTSRSKLMPVLDIPSRCTSAIVFGHFDGDGHLAADQTRYNLAQYGLAVTVIVSPMTRGYGFWHKLFDFDLTGQQLVVAVDIAFRFRAPEDSLGWLLHVCDQYPDKQFIVIDHHPLLLPDHPRPNLLLVQVPDPYDCCLGLPDPEVMQVAALCDGSPTQVAPTPDLQKRALGVKRAAADARGVAGAPLLDLIKERRWEFFEALAEEDKEMHRTTRGIRHQTSSPSPLLEYAKAYSSLTDPR